ncbi:ABC transporter ATP-binding protein [Cellulomonas shaoxiangyii]|uniref:ABC transporter ATP-binding protein n=1 Tax=Cellulomonas shaoxiangyii TaxID=2566013 RepID=A0A4P7SFT8_9CELL|nr:ABC transporter ATP-binding protein [Cellulomonas shaoxiangyii]QCB92367.1 ABC transporter ATP-binding protein [Cellulomonas shaoxiangyii]TGY86239.1 ABC transporter ATP-binding protein [Cellulomonas shaoxiangyii]
MATTTEPAIRVAGLRMAYGRHTVLDDVSFDIDGGVVALLGPNGAGKTTTVEILEGFRRRDAGTVRVLGADPEHADETWRARVGVVLQSWRDHKRWRVRELLDQLAAAYLPYAAGRARGPRDTDDLLARVGLTAVGAQRVGTLSGGQRRRLDVAVGLVGRPELLVLDEPTAGLDPAARREFHELLHEVVDDDGTLVLLTTHDLAEAEVVADRILVLAGGRIVADGSPDALARAVAGPSEVRWTSGGVRHVHSTDDPVGFSRGLLAGPEPIDELEVLHARLEDAYLEIVHRHEADEAAAPAAADAADAGPAGTPSRTPAHRTGARR